MSNNLTLNLHKQIVKLRGVNCYDAVYGGYDYNINENLSASKIESKIDAVTGIITIDKLKIYKQRVKNSLQSSNNTNCFTQSVTKLYRMNANNFSFTTRTRKHSNNENSFCNFNVFINITFEESNLYNHYFEYIISLPKKRGFNEKKVSKIINNEQLLNVCIIQNGWNDMISQSRIILCKIISKSVLLLRYK